METVLYLMKEFIVSWCWSVSKVGFQCYCRLLIAERSLKRPKMPWTWTWFCVYVQFWGNRIYTVQYSISKIRDPKRESLKGEQTLKGNSRKTKKRKAQDEIHPTGLPWARPLDPASGVLSREFSTSFCSLSDLSVSGELDCFPALTFPIGSASSCLLIHVRSTFWKWVGVNLNEAIFIAFLVAPGVTLPLWHTPWDLKIILL